MISYLPLAHIYEVCMEIDSFIKGCKIGYASAQTLFDQSPRLKKGQRSDCRALKPTIFAFVPVLFTVYFCII